MAEIQMPKQQKRPDESELEPIVSGTTRTKKKGLQKWKDVFIAVNKDEFEQSFTNNLLYPAARELVVRLAHGAIDILLNGAGHADAYYNIPSNDRIPYYRISNQKQINSSRALPVGKTAAGYSLDEIGFDTYDQASRVLNQLNEAIDQYGVIDVYAFFSWSRQPADHTDASWGWDQAFTCKPLLRRDGKYFLPLPKPKRISQR